MSERTNQPEISSKRTRSDLFVAALTICLGLVAFIVLGTFAIEGRTPATRAATALCMPLGVLWLILLGSAIAFSKRKRKSVCWAFSIAFAVLSIGTSPIISKIMVRQVEWPESDSAETSAPPFRTAIVLGGGVRVTANGNAEAGRDGERVISAAQLWHQGLTRSIICTGESPTEDHHPKDLGRQLLISLGVPPEVIFTVGGENTSQEMQKLDLFFRQIPESFPQTNGFDKVALITSAFHLSRAVRLAEASGLDNRIELEPFPTCFRSTTFDTISPKLLIPDADSATNFALAMKEMLAKIAGR